MAQRFVACDREQSFSDAALLHLRRAADVAAEQKAASEAEQALREGGIEGLEAWSEAARRRSRA